MDMRGLGVESFLKLEDASVVRAHIGNLAGCLSLICNSPFATFGEGLVMFQYNHR